VTLFNIHGAGNKLRGSELGAGHVADGHGLLQSTDNPARIRPISAIVDQP